MYQYIVWYTGENGSTVYDQTDNFIQSEVIKWRCWKENGNAHVQITIKETSGD